MARFAPPVAAALMARHSANAHDLAVYDGRDRIGTVIDIDGRHEAHAFDAEDRPLGTFRDRRVAAAAVSARHRFELDGGSA